MRIVIVVLTYNSARFIGPCLDALRRNTGPKAHVVVVDNDSSDGTLEIVRAEHPWAEAISTGANLGVSAGNNLALAQYDADHYVMLNPDTEVREGWLEALLDEARDPDVGIVGGKLLFPDGRIQHVGGVAAPYGPKHVGVLEDASAYEAPRDVDFVTLACGLIKRGVLERIGYLDESYTPYYYEDADFCYRARAAGFRVRYAPRCVVVHHENASTGKGQAPSPQKARIVERNRIRFNLQHGGPGSWLRASGKEASTLFGHARAGRARAILGAYKDVLRLGKVIRARRAAPAAFVASRFSPPDRHAPTRPVH